MKKINIIKSSRQNKRFRIIMDDGRYFDFGLLNGQTYIDHHNQIKRTNYLKRHTSNEKEKYLIDNLIPSAALFSAKILWGKFKTINKNINELNKLLINKC